MSTNVTTKTAITTAILSAFETAQSESLLAQNTVLLWHQAEATAHNQEARRWTAEQRDREIAAAKLALAEELAEAKRADDLRRQEAAAKDREARAIWRAAQEAKGQDLRAKFLTSKLVMTAEEAREKRIAERAAENAKLAAAKPAPSMARLSALAKAQAEVPADPKAAAEAAKKAAYQAAKVARKAAKVTQ